MRNLLITRFSALGDVAMSVPVVYNVCRSNPDVRFYYLTRRVPAQVFVNPPDNLTVVDVDLQRYKGVAGMKRLASELKARYGLDGYADLHDVLRTKLLRFFLRLSGVRVARIHKRRRARRNLTRRHNKVMIPLTGARALYREVFWRLGLAREDSFTGIYADSAPDPMQFAAATPPRGDGQTWVAIAPFARHSGKIYPAELMKQVVAELAARPGYKIFLLGAGEKESRILDDWAAVSPSNIVNMAPLRLGIPAEMALMSYCSAVISMDSANMHLASLARVPVVSIWGATHPYCGFMGWHQRRENTVQLDMVCRPCSIFGNKPCRRGDYHCLRGIPPSLVIARLDLVLGRMADDR